MLFSTNPNKCSTLALVLDFSLLLAFCSSVKGLLRYPFSFILFMTFSFCKPIPDLPLYKRYQHKAVVPRLSLSAAVP